MRTVFIEDFLFICNYVATLSPLIICALRICIYILYQAITNFELWAIIVCAALCVQLLLLLRVCVWNYQKTW